MQFKVKSAAPKKLGTALVVAGVYEKERLSPAAAALDEASGGLVSEVLRRGEIQGRPGQTLMLHAAPDTGLSRVLLVGLGAHRGRLDAARYGKVLDGAVKAVRRSAAKEVVSHLAEIEVEDRDLAWKVRQAVVRMRAALYRFERFKTEPPDSPRAPRRMVLVVPEGGPVGPGEEAARAGVAIANAVDLARDLGNLPGNVCTPSYLAEQARKIARDDERIAVTVLDEKAMEGLGMGALLSVARGSRQPAKLITLEYRGAPESQRPVVLVGKGVTFDSGGISIKPSAAMDEMKYDMCGAASVLGVVRAAAELGLDTNLVGVIPATENLPGGKASKPGDIVTSLSGQTIEILNTDAEGRLILCDALTYSGRFEPAEVIDIATLTGACVVSLGRVASGLLSNHPPLARALLEAGRQAADRAWELPLWEDYQDQLKSNFADMANIGGRGAGTITAACFLARYTKKYHWAHLDIAGTAWRTGSHKGATGRPVGLLVQYLLDRERAAE